jgi:hypothetical protein
MPIELSDIPAAAATYLNTQVTTTVSAVTPKDETQDVLSPGQDGTFTVTVTNAGPPDGVRLINVIYHVEISDGSVAKLIAPQSVLVAAFDKIDDTTPIPGGTQRGEMFVKTFTDETLDVGETQPVLRLNLHCLDQGDAEIRARIFAEVDQSALLPRSKSPNGEQTVKVV